MPSLYRLTIFYQSVNNVIPNTASSMLHIDLVLVDLLGETYFGAIDFYHGCWQIHMKENSQPIHALNTQKG